ncbi:NAD(P)-binding protein [Hypomontagnella monticulosa]|nr:NAD(P)-binding protein [Hypomontagnella monticulosa]
MVANKSVIFKKIPTGLPVQGEHLVIEDRPLDLDAVPTGGVVVEVLSISFDPYLRGRMRDATIETYSRPFILDQPIDNVAISRVLKSNSEKFQVGDLIYDYAPFAQYAALTPEALQRAYKINNPYNLNTDYFLGPLGLAGITAFSSLYKIGQPKKGEIIFVSSAAGAVGSVVGQLAKREGLTVIGSVGSDEKLDFIINELGFDAGFNYKRERPWDALARLAPNGFDIYYENVGGEHLEAALEHIRVRGRIIVSGMIEGYNSPLEGRYGVRNLMDVFAKRLTMAGFIVSDEDFGPAYHQRHQETVQKWIADGSFKVKLHVTHGLDNAVQGLLGLYTGKNFGKALLKVKD